ncbi:VOC family protein [Rosenbergiella nectarea]
MHLTLAVCDLARNRKFYTELLGYESKTKWNTELISH